MVGGTFRGRNGPPNRWSPPTVGFGASGNARPSRIVQSTSRGERGGRPLVFSATNSTINVNERVLMNYLS